MLKDTQQFLILILIIIIMMALFSFLLVNSFLPPEEQAPRRSRPVIINPYVTGGQFSVIPKTVGIED